MALIFPRIAKNFLKNGYFPSDMQTLDCVASALDCVPQRVRILDPCCGEGAALLHMRDHLLSCGASVDTFGIEIDPERAWHAKSVLDTVAHSDVHDVHVRDRTFGLLFLNPPYGDLVADQAGTGDRKNARLRHEKVFCKRTFTLLQLGGVLVLIVPFYVLDLELSTFIARHFERVTIHLAPEQQFKQCVVMGIKRKPATPSAQLVARLVAFGQGLDHCEMPARWSSEPYEVPAIKPEDECSFAITRLDARQVDEELGKGLRRSSLWPRFDVMMQPRLDDARPPMRAMTDWHLALALAAGQLSGVVCSPTGRRLLVKGRTHKIKDTQVAIETAADGAVTETRTLTDRFVTTIKALDLTPGPTLGAVTTIR